MLKKINIRIACVVVSILLIYSTAFAQRNDVVKTVQGSDFILHKVTPKQTWYELSRKYDVTVDQLMEANPGIVDLKIHQIVRIPVEKKNTISEQKQERLINDSKTNVASENGPGKLLHTVLAGESLYGISKRYNQSITDLRLWNALESDQISIGQQLIVGYRMGASVASDSKTITSVHANQPVTEVENKDFTRSIEKVERVEENRNIFQVKETGVAGWIEEMEVNPNKYYALHKSAPIGSIIKVSNRMNQRSVYVKVVGMLPDTGDNHGLLIKVSKAAATKMGVLDPRFQVELSYGIFEEAGNN